MYFCLASVSEPQFIIVFHNVPTLPTARPSHKHSNIQYQFLSILPSPDPHNKHSNIQYQFLSILPSPDPHNKHSNIQYQSLSILPFPDPHNKHSNIHYHFLLSLHITAARHAIKTDCGVGVAVVGNTCVYILKFKLPKYHSRCCQNSFVFSLYTVPTVQSQTFINHTPSLFSSQFSPASSKSTLTQHLPSLVQTL